MLLKRVITALVLLPPVLATLWFGSTLLVGIVFGAAVLVAAHEWAALAGVRRGTGATAAYVAVAAVMVALVVWQRQTLLPWALIVATCAWWLLMLGWIVRFPAGDDGTQPPRWLKAGAGLLVIPATIGAVMLLHGSPDGALRLLFAFVLVWAADVGAYFTGQGFGRHKLAPNVSPGKTWEGLAGGLAWALAIAWVAGTWLFKLGGADWLPFLLVCTAVVLLSIVGDLGESLIKRQAGVKDSGTLLPGHGGMLDRIDSLLAAVPAMALGLRGLGL
ncbi:MAG: phosphatidate cytidylyltransferase [Gammaproteobacteria bacterium]